jgi:hypothetical protein
MPYARKTFNVKLINQPLARWIMRYARITFNLLRVT